MKLRTKTYSGSLSRQVTARELKNRRIARKAAAEGFVLLKNDGVLPIAFEEKIALFGAGAAFTMKGGTGSGDVNERERVSIRDGLREAGYQITTDAWLDEFADVYRKAREDWRDEIFQEVEATGKMFIFAYMEHPFMMPCGRAADDADVDPDTKTAIFVLSRVAGEGADRKAEKGDYFISDEEEALLSSICARFEKVILLLNAGGPVDLSFTDRYPIAAILQISQPGMEAGNAVADVLCGDVVPGGKLTDTWAYHFEDYPNASGYSYLSGDVETEWYEEGIYVGYRYFDTFEVKPRYPFGFGLSYTSFEVKPGLVSVSYENEPTVSVTATVTNTGDTYTGKEVLQVYAACPQGKLDKEFKRLCGFAKTKPLAPGESQTLTVIFPVYQLASFSEEDSGWLLEAGDYAIFTGNSSENITLAAKLRLDADHLMVETMHICPPESPITELVPYAVPAVSGDAPVIPLESEKLLTTIIRYREEITVTPDEAGKLAQTLTLEQKIKLVVGDPSRGQENSNIGNAGMSVPGAAGETNHCAEDAPWNLGAIAVADGPAGVRLQRSYEVGEDGFPMPSDMMNAFEGGFFTEGMEKTKGKATYYQYCTAFPIGTLLAQSWDTALLEEVGTAMAEELEEFGVALLLAPGMNLHRNPLCGRNFEYYAEDPLLSGMAAAAITRGVQRGNGVGTTIKHFACNNQEDNRMGSNSILSERALRELYLRSFEIAVKSAQPMSLMTSYNLINGVHAANNGDMLNRVLRDEWGFLGFVMTDWGTTAPSGGSTSAGCVKYGNDLIMPGAEADYEDIKAALEGRHPKGVVLSEEELTEACRNLIFIIQKSLAYEDAKSYYDLIGEVKPYIMAE